MLQIKVFVFNPVRENTYLLYDETKEAVIIDCGADSHDEKKQLSDFIREKGLALTHVLNTHLHFDHILGNGFLYETYGLKPEYNRADEAMPGLKEGVVKFGRTIFKYEPVFAERYIDDKETVAFGASRLEALLTPGHSPGSLSFYSEKDACVFTGDALFRSSIGRTDLWEGNHETLVQSIKTKLFNLPDNTIVYPGHAEPSTIGAEKQYNHYV
ncbi:MAG: MBL fold metallo-hydrolase [Dysgonamonadaceae bacterium]|jgi:glyoxylase-like metal-dependent hydrolase (beta-lactamase superfamily II)|nr:MBL fold metallo-hydrolase [Dysgonamonadaceae bacterium]